MTDYTELKRLAEDAIDDSRCRHDFQMEVTPKVVLEMIDALDVQAGSIEAVQAANQRLAAERDKLRTQNQALVEALEDATDEIESWGAYASEYFQEKHDLAGNVAKFRAIAQAEGGV